MNIYQKGTHSELRAIRSQLELMNENYKPHNSGGGGYCCCILLLIPFIMILVWTIYYLLCGEEADEETAL